MTENRDVMFCTSANAKIDKIVLIYKAGRMET